MQIEISMSVGVDLPEVECGLSTFVVLPLSPPH